MSPALPLSNRAKAYLFPWLVHLLLLVMGAAFIWLNPTSDFVQDYASAWSWLHGGNANAPLAAVTAQCCAVIGENILAQTAHPPFATLLALPFALLPWEYARWTWLLVSWGCILGSWQLAKASLSTHFALLGAAAGALAFGSLEPLNVLLFTLALLASGRSKNALSGVLLGTSTALKVYPLLFLPAWLLQKRWVSVIIAVAVLLLLSGLCELVFGSGTTAAWLSYMPGNATNWLEHPANLSLSALLYRSTGLPITVATILTYCLLVAPFAFAPHKDVRYWLPAIIWTITLAWTHYLLFLALTPLKQRALVLLGVGGIVMYIYRMSALFPLVLIATICHMLALAQAYRDCLTEAYRRDTPIQLPEAAV